MPRSQIARQPPEEGWAAVLRPLAAVAGREPRSERVTSEAAEAKQRTRASGGGESPGLHGAKRRKVGDTPGAGFR
jgi:hypothetical protein